MEFLNPETFSHLIFFLVLWPVTLVGANLLIRYSSRLQVYCIDSSRDPSSLKRFLRTIKSPVYPLQCVISLHCQFSPPFSYLLTPVPRGGASPFFPRYKSAYQLVLFIRSSLFHSLLFFLIIQYYSRDILKIYQLFSLVLFSYFSAIAKTPSFFFPFATIPDLYHFIQASFSRESSLIWV